METHHTLKLVRGADPHWLAELQDGELLLGDGRRLCRSSILSEPN